MDCISAICPFHYAQRPGPGCLKNLDKYIPGDDWANVSIVFRFEYPVCPGNSPVSDILASTEFPSGEISGENILFSGEAPVFLNRDPGCVDE
jgi:hypothetical protein